ncbi:hypothetical protein TNCV_1894261 [Trichonephila clavipes]|nr:hypothetical protein TNCV_1894261 [Trichonephila clavipes]
MSLRLPTQALLVKLFYQNDNSAIVALRKFRTLKGMRKCPLIAINLRLMVEEDKASNVQASTSVRRVAEALWICLVQLSRRSCETFSVTIHQLVQELLLEYPLDRRSTLSLRRFSEYSQLSNLGIRQSAFHRTSSATLPKSNGVV